MSLPHGLLGLLNYKTMTGYELSKTFDDSLSFFWKAQPSQIYRELNRMEERGWLKSQIEIQTSRPNKRIYTITDIGKAELKLWLLSDMPSEFLPSRNEILIRVFFLAQNNFEDNITALRGIIKSYEAQLNKIEKATDIIASYNPLAEKNGDALYWEITGDFGEAYCKMCIEWAKSGIKKIEMNRGQFA